MIRVQFDTNIILDIALKREPHFQNAANLFAYIDQQKFSGFITATTITDIYYMVKKEAGHNKAIEFIVSLTETFNIIGVDKETILSALQFGLKDFEDAIQISAASFSGMDFIITRNLKHFKQSHVPVFSPPAFLEYLSSL